MKKTLLTFAIVLIALISKADVLAFTVNGVSYREVSGGVVNVTAKESGTYSGSIVVPGTVTYEGVTYSVREVDEYAFAQCANLTSVTFEYGVQYIGQHAFSNSGITSVSLPNSITYISIGVFYGCENLSSIEIPNSVTTIQYETFAGCRSLASVTIPDGVTAIEESAFAGCSILAYVYIPNSVTSIGSSVFYNCGSLVSVHLPEGITDISHGLFEACHNLDTITIPAGVTTIGANAFSECTGLDTVTCKVLTPPAMHSTAFSYVNTFEDVVLRVPCEKISVYQADEYWRYFNNMVDECGNSSAIEKVEENNALVVYPNPAMENITLTTEEDIYIYNNVGMVVKEISNPKGETLIDISDFECGVYYIRTGNMTQKLIKE